MTTKTAEMPLIEYIEDRRLMVEDWLQSFIHERYQDEVLEMVAYAVTGGKRMRGIMCLLMCEAMNKPAEDAEVAACAVELAHAASLVKDDVMDKDEMRRGVPSFFKRFGLDLALLASDVLIPHAQTCVQTYGLRATLDVAEAWAKITLGQLFDFPLAPRIRSYEQICALKTAPLFEVACALGIRAAKSDWVINLGKQYGYNCGMAFQVYDDYCDLVQVVGQPWEAAAKGSLPSSLQALRQRVGGDGVVTEQNCTDVLAIGRVYLDAASTVVDTFPESDVKSKIRELPEVCCNLLIAEVGRLSQ